MPRELKEEIAAPNRDKLTSIAIKPYGLSVSVQDGVKIG